MVRKVPDLLIWCEGFQAHAQEPTKARVLDRASVAG